jgi:hypothetical protein
VKSALVVFVNEREEVDVFEAANTLAYEWCSKEDGGDLMVLLQRV